MPTYKLISLSKLVCLCNLLPYFLPHMSYCGLSPRPSHPLERGEGEREGKREGGPLSKCTCTSPTTTTTLTLISLHLSMYCPTYYMYLCSFPSLLSNKLFFLNSTSLTPIHVYQWNATEDNHASCRDPSGSEETSVSGPGPPHHMTSLLYKHYHIHVFSFSCYCVLLTSQNPDYVCNNHIRLYRRLPSNSSQVLVCGTQAVVQPQCRILEVRVQGEGNSCVYKCLNLSSSPSPSLQISMSDDGTIAIKENAAVIASDGLVSYYPQFSQFGEFRHSDGQCLSASVTTQ